MNPISKTIVAYASFVRWVTLDSLWRFKVRALMILAAGALGVGFQVAVFGLLLVYARHFAVGDLIQVAGAQIDPRASWGVLALMGLAITILLLLSAVFIYISQRGILRMGREYVEFCAKRVFRLLGEGGDLFSTMKSEGSGDSFLLRLVRSDSRLAGRVLRMLLALAIPTATLVVAITVAFYLEPRLSLIIATLGSVFIVYQYRVSRLAAYYSMRFEKLSPAAVVEYRELIQRYKHNSSAVLSSFMEERLFASGAARSELDAYEGRLRSRENSRLVSGFFMAVVIGLILGIMGAGIIRQGAGWERLVLYLVALRFALTSLQSVFSSLTAINRFYPQVRRYMDFVLSFSPEDATRHPPRNQYAVALHDEALALPGSVKRVEIGRGDRVGLVTSLELNRYTLAAVCKALLGDDQDAVLSALHSTRYVSASQTCPTDSIRSTLRLSDTAQWNDLRGLFANDALYNEARHVLPQNLDTAMAPAKWDLLEPRFKMTLSLIAAYRSGCTWLFLDAVDLQVLDAEVVDFYLEKLSEAIVCILYRRNLKQVGLFRENWVVVADGQVVGIGSPDWFKEVELRASEIFEPNSKHKVVPNEEVDEE